LLSSTKDGSSISLNTGLSVSGKNGRLQLSVGESGATYGGAVTLDSGRGINGSNIDTNTNNMGGIILISSADTDGVGGDVKIS
jgi:hypothetical protein